MEARRYGALPESRRQADGAPHGAVSSGKSWAVAMSSASLHVCSARCTCSLVYPEALAGWVSSPPFSEEEVRDLEAQVPDPSALWAESQSPHPGVGSQRLEPISGSLRSELGNSCFWKNFGGNFLLHLALTPSGRVEKCNGTPGRHKQVQMLVPSCQMQAEIHNN